MTRVYIAGRFTAQARLRYEAVALKMLDPEINVVSSWLWSEESDVGYSDEQALEWAKRDCREVGTADVLIVDTIDESTTGGREVEFGMAGAWGIRTVVIGPLRNVFHQLASEHYDTWDEFFAWGRSERAGGVGG